MKHVDRTPLTHSYEDSGEMAVHRNAQSMPPPAQTTVSTCSLCLDKSSQSESNPIINMPQISTISVELVFPGMIWINKFGCTTIFLGPVINLYTMAGLEPAAEFTRLQTIGPLCTLAMQTSWVNSDHVEIIKRSNLGGVRPCYEQCCWPFINCIMPASIHLEQAKSNVRWKLSELMQRKGL